MIGTQLLVQLTDSLMFVNEICTFLGANISARISL